MYMEFYPINLVYFAIVVPVVILFYFIDLKLRKKDNIALNIVVLSILLFIVRLCLVLFGNTIGIMPYLVEDVIFYVLLLCFGIGFTIIYVLKIEKTSFKKLGWEIQDYKKSVLFGLIGFIPLICLFPVIIVLTNIQISIAITIEKVIVALCFTILGAFYEEIMFRGIIQNKYKEMVPDDKKVILFTALTFTLTHLFYLPFIGFGIYYIFVFVMALILSMLRIKTDQLACAILHGGIVFILIIAV